MGCQVHSRASFEDHASNSHGYGCYSCFSFCKTPGVSGVVVNPLSSPPVRNSKNMFRIGLSPN